jgi:hypothetical protein
MKNRICSLFFFLFFYPISFVTFGQQLESSKLESTISENEIIKNTKLFNNTSLIVNSERTINSNFNIQKNDSIAFPPTTRDYRRLSYNTALFVGASVVTFGVLYALPESFTKWDKQEMKENGIIQKWKQNVKAGPVLDSDTFFLNYVAHPYAGAVYYMGARGSGFTILESFAYSAIMSTFFWEYGVEAFAEIPSIQDIFITPIIGSAFGECFFYAKKKIIKNDKKIANSRFLGKTTLFLIDPFNTVLDGFGYQQKIKTQTCITPIGFDSFSKKPIWGISVSANF